MILGNFSASGRGSFFFYIGFAFPQAEKEINRRLRCKCGKNSRLITNLNQKVFSHCMLLSPLRRMLVTLSSVGAEKTD